MVGGRREFQAEEPSWTEVQGLEGACMFFLALNFQVSLIGPVRRCPQAAGVGTSLQSWHELCLKGPA